jgi:hypothetical protein
VIKSRSFPDHVASSCVPGSWSAILVLNDGKVIRGGSQLLLNSGVEVTLPNGTQILSRYWEERHAVTPMTTSEGNNRVAVIAFISSNVSQGAARDRKRARTRQEEGGTGREKAGGSGSGRKGGGGGTAGRK